MVICHETEIHRVLPLKFITSKMPRQSGTKSPRGRNSGHPPGLGRKNSKFGEEEIMAALAITELSGARIASSDYLSETMEEKRTSGKTKRRGRGGKAAKDRRSNTNIEGPITKRGFPKQAQLEEPLERTNMAVPASTKSQETLVNGSRTNQIKSEDYKILKHGINPVLSRSRVTDVKDKQSGLTLSSESGYASGPNESEVTPGDFQEPRLQTANLGIPTGISRSPANTGAVKTESPKPETSEVSLPLKKRRYLLAESDTFEGKVTQTPAQHEQNNFPRETVADASGHRVATSDHLAVMARGNRGKGRGKRKGLEEDKISKKPKLNITSPDNADSSTKGSDYILVTSGGNFSMTNSSQSFVSLPQASVIQPTMVLHTAPKVDLQVNKVVPPSPEPESPVCLQVPEVVTALTQPKMQVIPQGHGTLIPSMVEQQSAEVPAVVNDSSRGKNPPSSTFKAKLPKLTNQGTAPLIAQKAGGNQLISLPLEQLLASGAVNVPPQLLLQYVLQQRLKQRLSSVLVKDADGKLHVASQPQQQPQQQQPMNPAPQSNLQMLQEMEMAIHPDEDGDYPIHIAVAQGEIDVIMKLIDVMKSKDLTVDVTDANKQTPLHVAVIDNKPEIIRLLLSHGAKSYLRDHRGNSAFHLAVTNGSLDALKVLLDHKRASDNLNTKNYDGFTPLQQAVIRNKTDMVELLIGAGGVDINAKDGKSGRTALHHAAENNNSVLVELLLRHGANPNLRNYAGDTVIAAASGRSYMNIVGLLVKYGADTSQKNTVPESLLLKGVLANRSLSRLKDRGQGSQSNTPSPSPVPFIQTPGNSLVTVVTDSAIGQVSISQPDTPTSPVMSVTDPLMMRPVTLVTGSRLTQSEPMKTLLLSQEEQLKLSRQVSTERGTKERKKRGRGGKNASASERGAQDKARGMNASSPQPIMIDTAASVVTIATNPPSSVDVRTGSDGKISIIRGDVRNTGLQSVGHEVPNIPQGAIKKQFTLKSSIPISMMPSALPQPVLTPSVVPGYVLKGQENSTTGVSVASVTLKPGRYSDALPGDKPAPVAMVTSVQAENSQGAVVSGKASPGLVQVTPEKTEKGAITPGRTERRNVVMVSDSVTSRGRQSIHSSGSSRPSQHVVFTTGSSLPVPMVTPPVSKVTEPIAPADLSTSSKMSLHPRAVPVTMDNRDNVIMHTSIAETDHFTSKTGKSDTQDTRSSERLISESETGIREQAVIVIKPEKEPQTDMTVTEVPTSVSGSKVSVTQSSTVMDMSKVQKSLLPSDNRVDNTMVNNPHAFVTQQSHESNLLPRQPFYRGTPVGPKSTDSPMGPEDLSKKPKQEEKSVIHSGPSVSMEQLRSALAQTGESSAEKLSGLNKVNATLYAEADSTTSQPQRKRVKVEGSSTKEISCGFEPKHTPVSTISASLITVSEVKIGHQQQIAPVAHTPESCGLPRAKVVPAVSVSGDRLPDMSKVTSHPTASVVNSHCKTVSQSGAPQTSCAESRPQSETPQDYSSVNSASVKMEEEDADSAKNASPGEVAPPVVIQSNISNVIANVARGIIQQNTCNTLSQSHSGIRSSDPSCSTSKSSEVIPRSTAPVAKVTPVTAAPIATGMITKTTPPVTMQRESGAAVKQPEESTAQSEGVAGSADNKSYPGVLNNPQNKTKDETDYCLDDEEAELEICMSEDDENDKTEGN